MKRFLLSLLFSWSAAVVQAQTPLTADAAYDYLQNQRKRADAVVGQATRR
jgi:hypothetical protein